MAYSYCFSLLGNTDVRDFLQIKVLYHQLLLVEKVLSVIKYQEKARLEQNEA